MTPTSTAGSPNNYSATSFEVLFDRRVWQKLRLCAAVGFGTGVQAQQTSAIGFTAEAISAIMCLRAEDSPQKLTLWLVNATNPEFGSEGSQAVRHVGGFELKFGGAQSVLVTSVDFPIPATNTGTNRNLLVEYAVPQTVFADRRRHSARIDFLYRCR